MKPVRVFACLAVCGLALPVCADELYRQDPQNSFSGLSSQDSRGTIGLMYVTADNFAAQEDWTITSIEFWGGYPSVTPGATQGFMIRFYDDAGGTIGNMISTQDVSTFTETPFYTHPTLNWPGYHYTLTLEQPFDVPASGQYWIAVVALLTHTEPQWGWVASTGGMPPAAVQSIFGGPFTPQSGDQSFVLHGTIGGGGCYPNCDGSTGAPALNVADFGCFLGKFAAGDPYANCDGSTGAPQLNVADFGCFLTKFAAGCQ